MSDIEGFGPLLKKINSLEKSVATKIIRRGNAAMAQVYTKEMRAQAPRKSGLLKKQIKYTNKRHRQGGFIAKIGAFNKAYYAKFIHDGTKPHAIPSKRNRRRNRRSVMKFNGKTVSHVDHPGIKANPFIERVFKNSRKRALQKGGQVMFKLIAMSK